MSPTTRTAAMRLLTPFIVLALLASALFVAQRVASADEPSRPKTSATTSTTPRRRPNARPAARKSRARTASARPRSIRPTRSIASSPAATRAMRRCWPRSRPRRMKAKTSPRKIKQAKNMQEAQLLTILVEFNDAANDDFTGSMVPRDGLREPRMRPRQRPERSAPQQHPGSGDLHPRGQQHVLGAGLLAGPLQQDALHQDGHHRPGPARPDRSRRQGRHRHLRLHHEEHVRGDVQGRVHREWLGHAVGDRPAFRGVVRR